MPVYRDSEMAGYGLCLGIDWYHNDARHCDDRWLNLPNPLNINPFAKRSSKTSLY